MEKGTAEGVAIRSDGRLEAGPGTSLLYATGKSYLWSIASDAAGNGYLGLGGTASGSAVVMKVTPEGKASQIFEGKELAVQAVRLAGDGSLLVATSPDGKVYRVAASGGAAAVVFDPATTEEKPKYLWDLAVGRSGEVYVAAGAPAVVYRVPANGGKAEVLFRTADQHIRCLLLGADGTLWAGSDGSGVIYKFATGVAGAKPFAVYSAGRREITALAMDAAGNVYAAGVGTKGHTLPPLPVTGNVGISITFVQPGSSTAAGANTLVPDGSEIYRIAPDGSPMKLVTLKDDVVYALAVRNGSLLAATGNRGRVYRVDTDGSERFADVAHLEAAQGMAFAAVKDGLLVATSNSGKVFRLSDAVAANATYTSEVFDAQGFSQWGRAEVRAGAAAAFDLFADRLE
jgi:sugar lactone lactonase YvrE